MNNLEKLKQQIEEMKAEVERLEKESEKVKPLFPIVNCYKVESNGMFGLALFSVELASRQGSTAYTIEGAGKISEQRAARVRVLEAINQANKGDNGFKAGGFNTAYYYYHEANRLQEMPMHNIQEQECGYYFRKTSEAKRLASDPDFVKDWKLAKGIE